MKLFRPWVVIYLSLVFLSGAVVGALAYRYYTVRSAPPEGRWRSPEEMRRGYVEELRTRLKLREDQTRQLTEILDATDDRYRELRKKWGPEVKAVYDSQTERIRAMLDPAQRAEYEKMRQEREQRMRREREHRKREGKDHRRPPPPGPGPGPGPDD